MPELPEVETVCCGMDKALRGRTIIKAQTRREGLRRPFPTRLAERLRGRRIEKCRRRAKYIVAELDNGLDLVIHLGMSGQIFLIPPGPHPELRKHDHLVIDFDDGSRLAFNDARRFGIVLLLEAGMLAEHEAFRNLGPEPLERGFTGKVLAHALKGRKTDIKAALMDQRTVAGLGNIYVSEALFHAGIDPRRQAATIDGAQATRLVAAIKKVLKAAIAAGGSTLKDYRQADGELGYFQHRFAVYDREGGPCPGCTCHVSKTGGIERIVQGGRSTFFCPRKQK
jgi:formamidopyrimidine-DNA glycosylase